jgi:RNA polymerase sigma-70 factor (ECF subfamily)
VTRAGEAARELMRGAPAVATSPAEPLAAEFAAATLPLYDGLVRRLVLILGDTDEAEDIAQDAYLRAFRAWQQFDGRNVRGWLYTIALRLAFNRLRRRRRWTAILHRSHPAPWSDQTDPDLWLALRQLDGRTRAALLLNVLDGYTQAEIAAMFDVAEGTVA